MILPSKKNGKVALGTLGVLACLIVFEGWRLAQPKIHTATLAEVEGVLPPNLLAHSPVDPAAVSRLNGLMECLQAFDPKIVKAVGDLSLPPMFRLGLARRLWERQKLSNLAASLHSGPVRLPRITPNSSFMQGSIEGGLSSQNYNSLRLVQRALSESAELLRASGRQDEAIRCLLTAEDLAQKVWEFHGPIIQYLVASAMEFTVLRSVQDFAMRLTTSPRDCAKLLAALPAPPARDEALASSLRTEFQADWLYALPDPYSGVGKKQADIDASEEPGEDPFSAEVKTAYDAIETSSLIGRMFEVEMENADRPLTGYDPAADQIRQFAERGLPKPPSPNDPTGPSRDWQRFVYRLRSRNTDNYFGRVLISTKIGGRAIQEVSGRWRAMRHSVRILLASRLYRAAHDYSLPRRGQSLVAFLGTWPDDPFDGKPMRYDSRSEVVYSVGRNLVDDGGNIGGTTPDAKDLGISLTLRP